MVLVIGVLKPHLLLVWLGLWDMCCTAGDACSSLAAGAADTLHGFRRSRSSFTEPLRL